MQDTIRYNTIIQYGLELDWTTHPNYAYASLQSAQDLKLVFVNLIRIILRTIIYYYILTRPFEFCRWNPRWGFSSHFSETTWHSIWWKSAFSEIVYTIKSQVKTQNKESKSITTMVIILMKQNSNQKQAQKY